MSENLLQDLQEILSEADTKLDDLLPEQNLEENIVRFIFTETSKIAKEAPNLLCLKDAGVFMGKLEILERLMDLIENN